MIHFKTDRFQFSVCQNNIFLIEWKHVKVWKKGQSCKRRRQNAEREKRETVMGMNREERSTKEWWKSLKGTVKRGEEGGKSGFGVQPQSHLHSFCRE